MDARHSSELFTIQSELEDLPSSLGQIFLVAIIKDNGLPAYVCRSSRDKAFSVEKRLKDLRKLSRESYEKLGHGQDCRKCPKETSGGPADK